MHEQTRCFRASARARRTVLTSTLALATLTMTMNATMADAAARREADARSGAATHDAATHGSTAAAAQDSPAWLPMAGMPMPLWPNGAPGALGTADEDVPTLTKYEPKTPASTGTAVVVCPGGGYTHLAMDHEGKQIAEWLNTLGITAFVLKYRLGPRYHHPVMQQDVQRALRIVRAGAGRMNLREDRIGVMGFSAGGHLASTAATHFAEGQADAADPVERVGSRPDFAILGYPVITMGGPYVHKGSLKNLLGEQPDPALVELMSNEKQVTARTPPTFIFHTDDDPVVPIQNAIMFFEALKAAGVPGELHVYAHGKHGVGLAQADPVLSTWPARLADWLRVRELLPMPASWPTPAAPAQPAAR